MDFNIAAKLYNELKVFIDNDNQQGWAKFDISQFLTWRELKQRFKDIEDKLAPIDGICEFFMAYRVALDLSKLLETKVSVVMIAAAAILAAAFLSDGLVLKNMRGRPSARPGAWGGQVE